MLARIESYCENHFRVTVNGKGGQATRGEVAARKLFSKRDEFNELPSDEQKDAVASFIRRHINRDVNFGLFKRVGSVINLIDGSVLPIEWKRKYAVILRDSMYPPERVLCLHSAYLLDGRRELYKKWRFDYGLKSDRFAADIVELSYRDKLGG